MKTEGLVKTGQDIPKFNSSDSQIAPAENWVACQGFSRQGNDMFYSNSFNSKFWGCQEQSL